MTYFEARAAAQAAAETVERGYLKSLLEHTGWNLSGAAKLAKMDRSNLRRRLKQLGIPRPLTLEPRPLTLEQKAGVNLTSPNLYYPKAG